MNNSTNNKENHQGKNCSDRKKLLKEGTRNTEELQILLSPKKPDSCLPSNGYKTPIIIEHATLKSPIQQNLLLDTKSSALLSMHSTYTAIDDKANPFNRSASDDPHPNIDLSHKKLNSYAVASESRLFTPNNVNCFRSSLKKQERLKPATMRPAFLKLSEPIEQNKRGNMLRKKKSFRSFGNSDSSDNNNNNNNNLSFVSDDLLDSSDFCCDVAMMRDELGNHFVASSIKKIKLCPSKTSPITND